MTKLRKYMAESPADQPPPQKKPTECLVNGCPLPGVYRMNNESSICCVHDEEPSRKWAEQTTLIRNREPLWMAALDMTNAPAGTKLTDAVRTKLESAGAPAPKGVTVRHYGQQIVGWLRQECKGERDPAPIDVHRAETWKRLGGVA